MSLLNDVLSDLRDRRDVPNDETFAGLVPSPARRGRHRGWIAAGLAIAATAVVAAVLLERAPEPNPAEPPSVSARPPAGAGPAVPASSTPTPLQLDDIRVERGDGHARLHLTLSDTADYWIDGDPELGQLELVLAGARLATPLPALRFWETPIRAVQTRESDLGLHVYLELERGVRVQTQLVRGVGESELILDLVPARLADSGPRVVPNADGDAPTDVAGSIEIRPAAGRSARVEERQTADARRMRRRGAALLARRDYAGAVRPLENALAREPGHVAARRDHAVALIALGQLVAARESLAIGLSLAPAHRPFVVLQSRVLMSLGAHSAAAALLEAAVAGRPDDVELLELLAAAQQRADPARAAAVYRDILRASPAKANAWMGLGIALDGDGRSDEALAAFRMAASLEGLEPEARRWTEKRISALDWR